MKIIKIVFILTLPLIVRRVYMKKNCILILTFLIIFLGFASFSVNSIVVGAVEVNEFRLDCGVPGCPGHLIGEDPCPDPGWPPPVPKKLYFNTYNGGKNDMNTTKDVDNIINFFNNKDYTVINMINSNFSEMTQIEGGYSRMNRHYYFIASHGTEDGFVYFNPGEKKHPSAFPNMCYVDIAVFAICYGGKLGNAADIVTNSKAARYGLGWPGPIGDSTASTFTNHFWKLHINENVDVRTAVERAVTRTKIVHFFNFGNWGRDTIIDPKLYNREIGLIDLSQINNLNDINTKNKFKITSDYTEYKLDEDIDIYVRIIDGMITNDYVINDKNESKMYYSQEQIKALYHDNLHNSNSIILKNRNMDNTQILLEVKRITNDEYQENDLSSDITLENEYLIKKGNNYKHIKRLQVLYSGDYEYLKEIFWDTTNNKIVSSQEMQDYFPITNLSEKKYE